MTKMIAMIVKKINNRAANKTVADVLTPKELALWKKMNKSAAKAETKSIPFNRIPR